MGDGLSFAGGVTVRWAILDPGGAINDGGVVVVELRDRFGRRNHLLTTLSPALRSMSGQDVTEVK